MASLDDSRSLLFTELSMSHQAYGAVPTNNLPPTTSTSPNIFGLHRQFAAASKPISTKSASKRQRHVGLQL